MTTFRLREGRQLEFGARPLLMGVLNCTPDSFSDGGRNQTIEGAVKHAIEMLADGASIIDVGGESTRPGAPEVPVDEELKRVLPVIKALRDLRPDCAISVDTRKTEVASAALALGADIINDISGLQYSANMAKIAFITGAALCIMHMRGTPSDMQSEENLKYANLIEEVSAFLLAAAEKAMDCGLPKSSIILDPGLGFSKDLAQNVQLMMEMERFHKLGYPLLVGPSRKRFIGALCDEPDAALRDFGTCGAVACLAIKGIQIIRVHNVKATRQMLDVFLPCMTE